jgi:hypothetical protein
VESLQEDHDDIGLDSVEYSRESREDALSEPGPRPKGVKKSSAKGKRKKKRAEIRVQHSVHDRVQMESSYTFDLRPRSDEEQHRDFKVDFYLFLPYSVGVNNSNFDSDDFFRHNTSYLRVRAPLYQHLRTMNPADFDIRSADEYFEGHLSSLERSRLGGKVVQDVKLFGNFVYTEFKKLRSKLRKAKGAAKASLGEDVLHRTQILWVYRERYMAPIRQERYLLEDEVIRAFTLTDEYLSYRLELLLLKAKEVLDDQSRKKVSDWLEKEMEYRTRHGMLVLSEKTRGSVGLEAYTYRLGLLKKYLGEALFLKLESNKKDKLYRNYAAAIGAGLAATVAGLAEHQRVQYLTGNDSGIRLAFLIGIAVLAYIFKDRVKDLSKEYFTTRLKEKLPDQSFALSHLSHTSKGEKKIRDLGQASEYFRFIKKVPADVAYLRTLGQARTSDPARREHVIHVGRRFNFELRSKKHRKLFPLLKNVLRLDISPFLGKLDNPTMPINFVGPEGSTKTVQAPKVYHLNVVKRYEVKFGTPDGARFVDYERFRLVVDKNGIQRLDKIVRQGRLAYEAIGQ